MTGRSLAALGAMLAVIGLAAPANANSCVIVSTNAVGFTYDPTAGTGTASTGGTIQLRCTQRAIISVALSAGNSGSFAARNLTQGAAVLTYNLFTSAGGTTVWGDGTGGSSTVALGPSPNLTLTLPVNGTIIPAKQPIPAGTYTDKITVTVTF
ncbi:MAG: spore coat protein U domain-containing protein [Alphaproteobacteria bacterium]|nr:spore coat protein U domain-containing protein [Alphaproteobacteria bacterium]